MSALLSRMGPLGSRGESGGSTYVVVGAVLVGLGVLLLVLSGAIAQLATSFGRGVVVLTLFLFVPGVASVCWGVYLHAGRRSSDPTAREE